MITRVVDISSENGPNIPWGKFRAAGVELVILRVLKNGTEEDSLCHIHARGARSAGLRVGAYAFTRPRLGPPDVQADLARQIADDIGAEGLADDAEVGDGIPGPELVAWHVAFCTRADRPRTRTSLYTGPRWCREDVGGKLGELATRALWLSQYGARVPEPPAPYLEVDLWQKAGNRIVRLDVAWRTWPKGEHLYGAIADAAIAAGAGTVIAQGGRIEGFAGEVDVSDLCGNATIDSFLAGTPAPVTIDLSTVRGRQQALRALGRDPGALDGQWGARSTSALSLVQRAEGLVVDGAWGPKSERAVRDALAALGLAAAV